MHLPGKRRCQSKDAFQERCLSDTVCTDKSDFFTAFHPDVQRAGEWFIVSDHQILCLKDQFSGCTRSAEGKFRFWFFTSELDHVHLVELFLPRHRHVPGRDACLIAGNEVLQLGDFLLLTVVSRFELRLFHLIDLAEMVIIARITVERFVFHMINQIHDAVQKRNIMRDQDKSIFIIIQITLQPFDMSLIQIVCRLVKQKNIRLFKQKLCHEHLGTLSA